MLAAFLLCLLPALSVSADDSDADIASEDQYAVVEEEADDDFGDLSLEQLMEVEVTSVAGVEQSLMTTPSAIYVITGEDIRRTGHRSLAEVLRLVPGYHVGRINASQWGITSRGFNELYANKLLVLIDGRTVYDPLFAGTFWDVQDLLLEDVDRIEVIRGPGATLWGANAVNGVINVTTKKAGETQGLYITGGIGTEERAFGALRWGGKLGENAHYRIWSQYQNHDSFVDEAGADRPDDWDMLRGGFRIDWDDDGPTESTLQAEAYHSDRIGEGVRMATLGHLTTMVRNGDMQASGGYVLYRLNHEISEKSSWTLQTYYDRTNRDGFGGASVDRDTADVDFRHRFVLGDSHAVLWGLGIRYTRDETGASSVLSFDPSDRTDLTYSGFIQDTITIVPDHLSLMIGSKFETNDYTGFEIQPSGRLSWTPDENQTIWGSVSRAVGTPARINDDMSLITAYVDSGLITTGVPSDSYVPFRLEGNGDIKSEVLIAYELGYRVRPAENLSLDMTGFYNDYDRLSSFNLPSGMFRNAGEAESFGFEISAVWDIWDNWRLAGAYSAFRLNEHTDPGIDEHHEERHPHHQFNIRSYLDLTDDLELNAAVYYVDEVADRGAGQYVRLDVGLTWRPYHNVEISVWGQNLLDPSHREFDDTFFQSAPTEIERGVYAQVTFRF